MNGETVKSVFESLSKNLNENEKHFKSLFINPGNNNDSLGDNLFADITFDSFSGALITKISDKTFGKTAKTIKSFICEYCQIENDPPNHNIWLVMKQFTELNYLKINLNVTEIPSNAFQPIDGQESRLEQIKFRSSQNLTLKSGAFKGLAYLSEIEIWNTDVKKIESQSFNFGTKSEHNLRVAFILSKVTGEAFVSDSFNEIDKPIQIEFTEDINYIPESAFKSVLDKQFSKIKIYNLDCFDCRNYWLVKDYNNDRVLNAKCKGVEGKYLFDKGIKTKLNQKCK